MAVVFNGVGGGWTLGSAFTCTAQITPNNGTFSTGNFAISCTTLATTSATTRSILLGSSAITILQNVTFNSVVGLTFNAGTSTITFTGAAFTFTGGGQTFYNVNCSNTAASIGAFSIIGANTFNDLNVSTTTLQKIITLGANQTVNGTLTLGATNTAQFRMSVVSDVVGTPRTLTVATLATLADVDFRDIVAAGASAPWTGTRLGNCLNNSNITFAAGATKYWNLLGGGIWTSTAWALTSGGTPAVNNFPLAQDSVVIENTGLNDSATININTNADIGSLNTSTRALDMTLNLGNTDPKFYGNVSTGGSELITGSTSPTFSFLGQGLNNNCLIANVIGLSNFFVNCPNGSLTLQSPLTVQLTAGSSGGVSLTAGTFNLDGNNLTAVSFNLSNTVGTARIFTQGSGTITATGNNGAVWTSSNATGLTYTTPPTINATYSGSVGTRTFAIGPTVESNAVNINVTAGSDAIQLTTSSGTYGSMNFTGFTGSISFGNTISIYGSFNSGNATSMIGTGGAQFFGASATKTIQLNGLSFPAAVGINGVGAVWNCIGALNVVANLSITNGTLNLAAGTTSTVGSFSTIGTSPKFLGSTTPGTQATISDASGTNTVSCLTIQDSNATGGAVWNALATTNVDAGNNTGWLFSTTPSISNEITMRLRSFTQPRRF
jgi:hypothetical protein